MFSEVYKDKTVLITGHTGFKGSWLTTWLLKLGAKVIGVSKDIPSNPAMFEVLELQSKIEHKMLDIRKFDEIHKIIISEKPDFIFHLAAQAIVSSSYSEPLETITSNILGTAHLLESLRLSNHRCTAIIITSDKAYDNVEQVWGYKETDALGGKDVYSASKGAADLLIKSYYHSFFKLENSNVRICSARAGNVIGGGDWAKDRVIVDAIIAWSEGKQVEIRSPYATRPWQHVLEPLSGYLSLGEQLPFNSALNGEAFNFGPPGDQNKTVLELLGDSSKYWGLTPHDSIKYTENHKFHEAGLLKLNCEKALVILNWKAALGYNTTIKLTNEWYYMFYKKASMFNLTQNQITEYEDMAKSKKLCWTE